MQTGLALRSLHLYKSCLTRLIMLAFSVQTLMMEEFKVFISAVKSTKSFSICIIILTNLRLHAAIKKMTMLHAPHLHHCYKPQKVKTASLFFSQVQRKKKTRRKLQFYHQCLHFRFFLIYLPELFLCLVFYNPCKTPQSQNGFLVTIHAHYIGYGVIKQLSAYRNIIWDSATKKTT